MKYQCHLFVCLLAATILTSGTTDAAEDPRSEFAVFDTEGNLLRPQNYRSWIYAGGVTTPKAFDENVLFPDFQNIYIDPVSFAYWKKHGTFRDGTILVKELLYQSDVTDSPVGKGFFMGPYRSLSATVKSKEQRAKSIIQTPMGIGITSIGRIVRRISWRTKHRL